MLHSNFDGEWKDFEEPLSFVGNRDGKAVYEISLRCARDFEYTIAFEGQGALEWAELPEGKNGRVSVRQKFQGSTVFVGMEFAPIKVGGQGDVMRELPKGLVESGLDVSVIIPDFRLVADKLKAYDIEELPDITIEINLPIRGKEILKVKKLVVDGIKVYLLSSDSSDLFRKPYPCSFEGEAGIEKEFYESILLSQGALKLIEKLSLKPQVVHSNDHHAALIPLYMRTTHKKYFNRTASVFTIHNIGYQGVYPLEWLPEIGVKSIEQIIVKSGSLNFMAVPAGVIKHISPLGNYINTVSKTYAAEIRQTYFEIDMLLQEAGDRFDGILNGIDFDVWDPSKDNQICQQYDISEGIKLVAQKREINKAALYEVFSKDGDATKIGLNPQTVYGSLSGHYNRPLIGVVSRLVDQKQIDIVAEVIRDTLGAEEADYIILGSGEEELEEALAEVASLSINNGSFVFVRSYNDKLARLIYAGADMLLVPSDYEPSGLTQMIAMRYGSIPVVRKTGGLADTVSELKLAQTGFVFDGVSRTLNDPSEDEERKQINKAQLRLAILRAIRAYKKPRLWKNITTTAMQADNRWSRSIKNYTGVYSRLIRELNPDFSGFPALAASWAKMPNVTMPVEIRVGARGGISVKFDASAIRLTDDEKAAIRQALLFSIKCMIEENPAMFTGGFTFKFNLTLTGAEGKLVSSSASERQVLLSWRAIRTNKRKLSLTYPRHLALALKLEFSDEFDHMLHPDEDDLTVHKRLFARIEKYRREAVSLRVILSSELDNDIRAAEDLWCFTNAPKAFNRTVASFQMEMGIPFELLDKMAQMLIARGSSEKDIEEILSKLSELTMAGGLGALMPDLIRGWADNGIDTVGMFILYSSMIKGIGGQSQPIPAGYVDLMLEALGEPVAKIPLNIWDRPEPVEITVYSSMLGNSRIFYFYCPEVFDELYPDNYDHRAEQ
ncbi:MAG: glycogen/starch synthase, partial [Candidatus Omnitrophica bacterium]|nr:glycogen/starch synthase [Candidatus Omnitrophota bacterium]